MIYAGLKMIKMILILGCIPQRLITVIKKDFLILQLIRIYASVSTERKTVINKNT